MFTFACASIEGLTLNQKRETLKALKASISAEVALKRDMRAIAKAEKAERVAAKREAAIVKAQQKLQRLLDKAHPVGTKAIKANRKPTTVSVVKYA